MYEQRRPNSKDVLFLKQNISLAISTIVILNNVINIAGAIFVGNLVTSLYGNEWLGIASAIMTLAIILLGEMIPKTLGERYKTPVSLLMSKPLRFLVWILRPFVGLANILTKPFVGDNSHPKVTEDEIRIMLNLGKDEGTVEMDEAALCGRVFKLNDVRAMHIMKPIEKIFALPGNKTLGELKEEIINARYSRIAVYNKNVLDIIGMVQQRVLLREIARDNYEAKINDFMSPPIFVSWITKADALLEMFRNYHQHLFFVQDANKKTVGLVSMEDVLEELFGEIYDEKDQYGASKT